MSEGLMASHEGTIRLTVFLGLFLVMAVSEFLRPRRPLKASKSQRWFTNWSIVIIDSVVVRLIFTAAAVGPALWAQQAGFGLFNLISLPPLLEGVIAFLMLDFAVWLSHLLSHKVPLFWRIHRMHHSDVDFDVTTAIRFHPIEIVLSMIYKIAVVVMIGAPAEVVILFEIVLNGGAMFNHANLRLPPRLDQVLRLLIVTPDMHRVHHSVVVSETDSNYGFNFSFWDRMFGTYTAQPQAGHQDMTIGIAEWQDSKPTRLDWSLMVPFRK